MGRRSRLESVSIPSLEGGRVDLHSSFSLSLSLSPIYPSIFYPYLMLTLVHVSNSCRPLSNGLLVLRDPDLFQLLIRSGLSRSVFTRSGPCWTCFSRFGWSLNILFFFLSCIWKHYLFFLLTTFLQWCQPMTYSLSSPFTKLYSLIYILHSSSNREWHGKLYL